MGALWMDGVRGLPNLLDVVRHAVPDATGCDGWTQRSRSSGGYDPPGPLAVIVHHTASPASSTPGRQFENDAAYCCHGHPDAPVSNMVLGPEGQVRVLAAGASNHAGEGGPWTTSGGVVPASGMNSRSIGIEASNDGQGQPWDVRQQDAYVRLVVALCDAYGLDPLRDVVAHYEWAGPNVPQPGRKCDPAGPARWAPMPTGGCSARNYWDMHAFRAEVATGAPTQEEDDMAGWLYRDKRYSNVFVRGQGPATPVTTEELQAGGLGARLGETVVAQHDPTLEAITAQAWGMTVAEAEAAHLLVR